MTPLIYILIANAVKNSTSAAVECVPHHLVHYRQLITVPLNSGKPQLLQNHAYS